MQQTEGMKQANYLKDVLFAGFRGCSPRTGPCTGYKNLQFYFFHLWMARNTNPICKTSTRCCRWSARKQERRVSITPLLCLGIWHEHQRPDRDNHINVTTDNAQENEVGNFMKLPSVVTNSYGSPYDLSSVSHYDAFVSTRNSLGCAW